MARSKRKWCSVVDLDKLDQLHRSLPTLTAEEERLRDAVVEAAVAAHEALLLVRDIAARQQRLADIGEYSDALSAEHDVAGPAYHEKFVALFESIRALRAHREKVSCG